MDFPWKCIRLSFDYHYEQQMFLNAANDFYQYYDIVIKFPPSELNINFFKKNKNLKKGFPLNTIIDKLLKYFVYATILFVSCKKNHLSASNLYRI